MSTSGNNAKDFMTALMLVLNYSRQSKNDELSNELTKLRIEHEKLSISKESAIPNAMASGANNVDRNIAAANGGTRKSSGGVGDPVASDLPTEAKAFLNGISSPESGGKYNAMYPGTTFSGFADHPRTPSTIDKGPNAGKTSDAAGRYQFLSSTWDKVPDSVFKDGKRDFSEANQDRAAWWLAQNDYKTRTGKDLLTELKSNGFSDKVSTTLSPTWEGLKTDPSSAASTYADSIKRLSSSGATPLASTDKKDVTAIPAPTDAEYAAKVKEKYGEKPKSEKKAELEDTTPDSNSSDVTRLAMLSSDDSTTPSDTNSQVAQDTAIPTNDIDLYSMFSAKGGPVAHYADGGPVDEEDDGSNPLTNPLINPAIQQRQQEAAQRQQPSPEDYQASAAPQSDGLGQFASDLNSAINGGFDWIAKNFNLSSGSAIPGNAQAANGREAFLRGEGGLSREQIVKLEAAADPNGQLTESLRRTAALHAGYKAYMAMGDVDKAQQFAAAMMIGCRDQAVSLGPQIIKELNKGNVSGAAKLFEQASNETPDGSELSTKVDKDGGVLARKVGADGKVAWEGKVTPQMMMQAALGISNGSEYWKQLALTAGRKDPQHSEEKDYSQGYKDFTNRVQGGNTAPMSAEEAQSMPRAEQAQAEQFRQQAIAERQRKGDDAYFNPQQQAVPTPNSNPDAAPQATQGAAPQATQGAAQQGAIPTHGQQPTGGDPREEISRVIGQRPDFTPDQIKQLRSDSMSPQGKAAAIQEMKARQHDWDTRATMLWKERQQQLAEATKADRAEQNERNSSIRKSWTDFGAGDTESQNSLDKASTDTINSFRAADAYKSPDDARTDNSFLPIRGAVQSVATYNSMDPVTASKYVQQLLMPATKGNEKFAISAGPTGLTGRDGTEIRTITFSNGQSIHLPASTLQNIAIMRGVNTQAHEEVQKKKLVGDAQHALDVSAYNDKRDARLKRESDLQEQLAAHKKSMRELNRPDFLR